MGVPWDQAVTGPRADIHGPASPQTREFPKALDINTLRVAKWTLWGIVCWLRRRCSLSGVPRASSVGFAWLPLRITRELLKDSDACFPLSHQLNSRF